MVSNTVCHKWKCDSCVHNSYRDRLFTQHETYWNWGPYMKKEAKGSSDRGVGDFMAVSADGLLLGSLATQKTTKFHPTFPI